jgi:glycosyltransferase involved in cell wall biosynthesis/peptidoglycan/xylan/chitin deacetylase (PgdA/CDA1 family)
MSKLAQNDRRRSSFVNELANLPLMGNVTRRIFRSGASVFMFHRVLPLGAPCYDPELATSEEVFANTLDWLKENSTILPLDVLAKERNKRNISKKPLCAITFDDGWRDNFQYAFPILRARNIPATIFLPVRFVGTNRRFWQERLWQCAQELRPAEYRDAVIEKVARHFPWFPVAKDTLTPDGRLKRFLLTRSSEEAEEFTQDLEESAGLAGASCDRAFLNWDEVLAMHGSGISFGSHTLNHVLLSHLEPARALVEVRDSRRELQERLGSEVLSFAYPWGAATALVRDAVREAGYGHAVATNPGGLITAGDDPWYLPRIAISDSIVANGAKFNADKTLFSIAKSACLARVAPAGKRRPSEGDGRTKIVFVLDEISQWEGGTERQLHALIQALDRNYFDPELCLIFRPAGVEIPMPCKTRFICPDANHKLSLPARLFRLARLLRRMRPHIVQTFFIEGIFLGIVAGRLSGVPAIVGSRRNGGYRATIAHRIALRLISFLAHTWQCNSRAMWDYARSVQNVPAGHLELLPNGIDLTRFAPVTGAERSSIRQKLRLNDKGPIFVSVAALTTIKDFPTLLDAAKSVRPHLPDAQVLIVGDGPLREELELHARTLNLGDMVRFVGRESDVHPYLAAADFGVLTSHSEGSSNSVLEYMAMGLPSVVSDIPPNRELVSGLFFAPGNAADLAEKLVLIAKDASMRSRLRAECLATASQYSLRKFALRAQSYYTSLASACD